MFKWLRDMLHHLGIRINIKSPIDCLDLGKDLSDEDFEKYKEAIVGTLVKDGVHCMRAAESWPEERVEPYIEQFIEATKEEEYFNWDVYKLSDKLLLKYGKPFVEHELNRNSKRVLETWPLEKLLLLGIPERLRHTSVIVDAWMLSDFSYYDDLPTPPDMYMSRFLELTNSLTERQDTAEQWSQVRDQRGLEDKNAFGIWDQIVNEGRTWVLDLNKDQQAYVIRACTTFGGLEVHLNYSVNDCIQAYFSALESLKGEDDWNKDMHSFANAVWKAEPLTAVEAMRKTYCHLMNVQLSGDPLWYLRMPIDAMRACSEREHGLVEDAWQYAKTKNEKRTFIEGFRDSAARGKATSWAKTIITHFEKADKEDDGAIGGSNYRVEALHV